MRNVSLWGAGKHAQKNLLPSLIKSEKINLIGIYTRNKDVVNELRTLYDVKFYGSEQEILGDSKVDTVVIANPTGLHFATSEKVIKSGKNVWSEKSLCLNDEELMLLQTADKMGLEIRELFMFIYHPQFILLQDLMKSGKYGKLISIHCKFGMPHLESSNIRYDSKIGGGSLLDVGCYPIAATHSLLGHKPVKVYSKISFENNYQVDTKGHATFEYEDGTYAFMEWGFGMSYANSATLWFENAVLSLERFFSKPEDLETSIRITNSWGDCESLVIKPTDHFKIMFNQLCNKNDHNWIENQSKLLSAVKNNLSIDN